MKLIMLSIKNFRQFYSGDEEQEIIFSRDTDKNITVIHGENGSGKTALLNSLFWVFYGAVSKNMENPERLVNERAISEVDVDDEVEIKVTITFDHDDKKYTACRIRKIRKKSPDDLIGRVINEDLYVDYIDITGRSKEVENPESSLKQILPPQLKELFFFHGEYIDNLSKEENSQEVQKAIRNIMGLTILERSISHLNIVSKAFEREMEKYGSEEIKKLIADKNKLEEKISKLKDGLITKKDNLKSLEDEKEEVSDRLKEYEEVRQKQIEREKLDQEQNSLIKSLDKVDKNIKELCSKKSCFVFISDIPDKVSKILDEKRVKKQIPALYTVVRQADNIN